MAINNFSFKAFNEMTQQLPPLMILYCVRSLLNSCSAQMIRWNNENAGTVLKISVDLGKVLDEEKEASEARKAAKAKTE
jgi:hypothetical protein